MSIQSSTGRPHALWHSELHNEQSQPGRLAVPWKTVLTLAVAMAAGDGFWLVSLQGAVGAIERTQSPFATWWRESLLVLPLFVLAVLGALTLAIHRFGPVLRNRRTVVATGLLIAAAGTLASLAVTIASSAYDYHLQVAQLRMMDAMQALCTGSCLAQEKHATLALQIHGVLYISRWLLLTNLVLVTWWVAMWGGQLTISKANRPQDRPTHSPPATGSGRADDLRLLLVGALIASATIHIAVAPQHLSEWPAAGLFFLTLTIWELAVAGMLLARLQGHIVLLYAAAISVGPLALWLYTRTAGLPLGPHPGIAEAVGLPDIAACALELAALLAAGTLLHAKGQLHQPPASAHQRALIVTALVATTAIGLAGSGISWLDAFAITGNQSVMHMTH